MATNEKLLIIDAHALIHRAYHALPDLTAPDGAIVGAVYGFTSVLIKVIKELQPSHVVAAFDLPEPTFRHEAYKEYKANRGEADETLMSQFSLVKDLLESFDIPVLEKAGFEADDVIGTIVEKLKKKDTNIIIATGDLDTLQLVSGNKVVVYTLRKGVTDTIIYTEEKARERFGGIDPIHLTDYKGLKGDPSDNIPGLTGVGDKTATDLLTKYKTIEKIYEKFEDDEEIKESVKKKLRGNKDQALFSKELGTIRRDVPLDFSLPSAKFELKATKEIISQLEKFGFRSLVRRLEKDSPAAPVGEQASMIETKSELEELYKNNIFSKKIYDIEKALDPILRKIEKKGFLLDIEVLTTLSEKISKELAAIQKKVHKMAGEEFNINSPQEVSRIIHEKMDLGRHRRKKTKTGSFSTAAAELEKIKAEHEIVPLLLRWRELSKLLSTYVEALPRLVGKDGRVHTTFNQFGAATGRLSSENPNMQNIPIKGELGKQIRSAFVADKGSFLIAADYSQIELRIAAALSGDATMVKAFESGEDIHARTAAEVFNVPMNEVTKDMRRRAKILNFGVLYGMGPRAFAASAEVSQEEAKGFIDEYKADFGELTKYLEDVKSRAYSQGYIGTHWGRKRELPELSSANPGLRAAAERMAINMPVQGTAADFIKAAMVAIEKEIESDKDIFMILQVHDELIFECKKEKAKEYAEKIRDLMVSVNDLDIPITVDVEIGPNWGDMKKV